ncbi:MAG: hypothetical protein DWI59_02000 [Chloroflexi bacterium]|nr:MAG: hypothetical protein DWI59_02000 [Chloroflexota bacterium]
MVNSGLRIRILVLQVGLIGILLACSGFLLWGNRFVHGMIREQLAAQQIFFPPAGSPGLRAEEFPDLQQYGGRQLDDGAAARAYANGFIGRHLEAIAAGKTYSQVSTAARANPTDAKLQGQVDTLFKGETLRGLLLNAYGWWEVGQYALYASASLAAVALAVLVALLFECAMLAAARRSS